MTLPVIALSLFLFADVPTDVPAATAESVGSGDVASPAAADEEGSVVDRVRASVEGLMAELQARKATVPTLSILAMFGFVVMVWTRRTAERRLQRIGELEEELRRAGETRNSLLQEKARLEKQCATLNVHLKDTEQSFNELIEQIEQYQKGGSSRITAQAPRNTAAATPPAQPQQSSSPQSPPQPPQQSSPQPAAAESTGGDSEVQQYMQELLARTKRDPAGAPGR